MEGMGWPELLPCLLVAAVLGLIPAAIAHRKGRGFVTWWIMGALAFIIALPMALIIKTDTAALEKRQLQEGNVKKCPHCAELIKAEAKVCKHCGRKL
jgi:integral membrane sensor domain MASE1